MVEQGITFNSDEVAQLLDTDIVIAHGNTTGHIGELETQLDRLSSGTAELQDVDPMVGYVAALKDARSFSGGISGYAGEISAANYLSEKLDELALIHGLPEDHYSIDTSGAPILVRENGGEHVILPTHFEKGAYFSHPHADHQLGRDPRALPRISIGRYTRLGGGAGINAGADIHIGSGVWLAPKSYMLMQEHRACGRPAVGARTVGMTELPGLTVEDHAWVGKEAVVGWNTGYVGKASVVATGSMVNGMVGDYSLTGERGRILGYYPYKAAAIENMRLSLEQMLQISDWTGVQRLWQQGYRQFMDQTPCREALPSVRTLIDKLPNAKGHSLLDMNPGIGNNVVLASSRGITSDAVMGSRGTSAVILQRVQDGGKRNVRLRGGVDPTNLPLPDSEQFPLKGRNVGYNVVLDTGIPQGLPTEHLQARIQEASRVALPGGEVLFSVCGDFDDDKVVDTARESGLVLMRADEEKDAASIGANTIHFRKV